MEKKEPILGVRTVLERLKRLVGEEHQFGCEEGNLDEVEEFNPFAVCRAMQKKHGWSEEKYERCVREAKKRAGAVYEAIRKFRREMREVMEG